MCYVQDHRCLPRTFHQFYPFPDVILVLALDEMPGICELEAIGQPILCDTLAIDLLMSLQTKQKVQKVHFFEFIFHGPDKSIPYTQP